MSAPSEKPMKTAIRMGGMRTVPLLPGNLRVPDHLRPAIDLHAHELVELLTGRRRGRHPQLGQALLDLGYTQYLVYVGIYLVEQRRRCGRGRAHAIPEIGRAH